MLFLGDCGTISIIPLLKILFKGKHLPVAVLEFVYCEGYLADGGGGMERLYVLIILRTFRKMILITQSQMFSCLMELRTYSLLIQYPNISFMPGVEHTVYLFFNDVSGLPVVNQMITAHKAIFNLFGYGIYQKPHSIFKSKSYEFQNGNIFLFSGNDTSMDGYFTGMHIDMLMRKSFPATVSSE